MKRLFLSVGLVSLTLVSGCAPLIMGAVSSTGTSVAVDRRNVGDMANDGVIESKASIQLTQANFSSDHITCTSYEGRVLLSGEIGTAEDKEKATEIVKSINGVTTVYNELAVMENVSISNRMSDSITASKVRASIIDTKGVTINAVKIVVERGICYLMGTVTKSEEEIISKVAANTKGVEKVVNLLTVISQEEREKRELIDTEEDTSGANKITEKRVSDTGETGSTEVEPAADTETNPI